MNAPSNSRREALISDPKEDLAVEYKQWLDLKTNEHRATLAKAAIALANHGGGFIVIGFVESSSDLQSQAPMPELPAVTQDVVNGTIRRYAEPEFHCAVHFVEHLENGVVHPVVEVPGGTVPVMAKRGCNGVIAKHRCYVRKPGPRSEEPQSGDEWRRLLDRCVRSARSDMLDAIRAILEGKAETPNPAPDAQEQLRAFCEDSRGRWQELVEKENLPKRAAARFPSGWYEIAFSLIGAQPAVTLTELRDRLAMARTIQLTGWPPFLDWEPYPHGQCVEAWAGYPAPNRTMDDPSVCDYWRSTMDGDLYTIRGYTEDRLPAYPAGTVMDLTLPVWRVAESILFAGRFAETFEDATEIAVRCRFTGLNGRRLTSVTGSSWPYNRGRSRTNEVPSKTTIQARRVQDNIVEIVHQLLAPLYEAFEFSVLPEVLVKTEIRRMIDHK